MLSTEFGRVGNAPPPRRHPPADILEADNLPEHLVSRFQPEERDRIAHDLETELETLRHYIQKGRLDDWFPTLVNSAKETAKSQTQPSSQSVPDGEIVPEMSGALATGGGDDDGVDAPERRALRWV
jgi:hypothetical protein